MPLWEENKKIAWECKPPQKNKGSLAVEPIDDGTRVVFEMEYELPYSIIGMIIDRLKVRREMEDDVSKGLKNLRGILEK